MIAKKKKKKRKEVKEKGQSTKHSKFGHKSPFKSLAAQSCTTVQGSVSVWLLVVAAADYSYDDGAGGVGAVDYDCCCCYC
jgi:hypothetical protein